MICPPLNELANRADSKYSLVIATAKRARELAAGAEKLVQCSSKKPVTIAINEIAEGKIKVYN